MGHNGKPRKNRRSLAYSIAKKVLEEDQRPFGALWAEYLPPPEPFLFSLRDKRPLRAARRGEEQINDEHLTMVILSVIL